MINDLKINRYSKLSIFFRFQWSLNMHAKKWKVPNRRAAKKNEVLRAISWFFFYLTIASSTEKAIDLHLNISFEKKKVFLGLGQSMKEVNMGESKCRQGVE